MSGVNTRPPARARVRTAPQGVSDRTGGVDRQLVAEDPWPGQPGRLVRGTGPMLVVTTVATGGELCEHPPQCGLTQPADCPWRQPQTVLAASQKALPFQLPFEIAERRKIARRVRA